MKKNQIVRNHSDIAECRGASAQHYQEKLDALMLNIRTRKSNPFPTDDERFQIGKLKAEIGKWNDESQRHAFQAQLHNPVVCVK